MSGLTRRWSIAALYATNTTRSDVAEIDKINELPEPDDLPSANEDSAEYKAGFQAGKEGKPSDGKTVDWHRGWADAQE
jgi:hypothetical protein